VETLPGAAAVIFSVQGRALLERMPWLRSERWRFSADRFQPFNHTLPDRYPWLFSFARQALMPQSRILSFGCSTGEELLSLRRYLPLAQIKGIDINPGNIAIARAQTAAISTIRVACVGTTAEEPTASYDAVFCLAVLCDGRLTARNRDQATPFFSFERFQAAVDDLARCLKPGGLLFLLTTNFRFCDTDAAGHFETVLSAREADLAPDLLYDRDNRLMPGARYNDVVFRKRAS
jgi:SAM-dependent methyltransferase